jgi:hypothetical protein
MRKVKDDTPVRIVDAAALLFTVLLFFFEIRHTMTGGDPYAKHERFGRDRIAGLHGARHRHRARAH